MCCVRQRAREDRQHSAAGETVPGKRRLSIQTFSDRTPRTRKRCSTPPFRNQPPRVRKTSSTPASGSHAPVLPPDQLCQLPRL
ncbi:hypothetical protein ANANG_G00000250 [Anguilla anguilla]|uniref:Uncharacterized protein n=1 Tax=Anguilla anguilla TaxID=7936 RepID=A0A9D3MVV4_ANGAN|nr:hypothetical protein ANANG_G00000250 [Anguilla anguilla]